MFTKNVGALDGRIRLAVGTVALVAGVFVLGAPGGSVFGLVAVFVGVIGLVTGTTRRCPTYSLLGVDTLNDRFEQTEAARAHA